MKYIKEHKEEEIATMATDHGGTKLWTLKTGQLHREGDLPAIIRTDGTKKWYKRGNLHRINGPALITSDNKQWWISGGLHREDGPAIEHANGDEEWYVNGLLHREDGPAAVYKHKVEYYLRGIYMSKEDYNLKTTLKKLGLEDLI